MAVAGRTRLAVNSIAYPGTSSLACKVPSTPDSSAASGYHGYKFPGLIHIDHMPEQEADPCQEKHG